MSLPRYPEYKSSGAEWMGEVPRHWDVGLLTRFARMKTGHTPSRNIPEYWKDCTIPWFGLADVWQLRDGKRWYLGDTAEKISILGLENSAAELLPAGTVVFSRTASVGFSGIMPVPMATTQDFWNWICGPRLLPEFLLLLFRAMSQEFRRLTMGSTHKTIYQPDAASLRICAPSIQEQQTVVEFVRAQLLSIDSLIAEQERLIELLKEKCQSIISHAVTNGLKPAGTKRWVSEFLGEIPSHWETKPLAVLSTRIGSGKTPLGGSGTYLETGIPFVRSQNVYDEGLRLDDMVFISEEQDEQMRSSRIVPGDILLNITGASLGRTCLVPATLVAANVNQHVCAIRIPDPSIRAFVAIAMKSDGVKGQINAAQDGAAREGLNYQQIRRLRVALPPEEEREAIVVGVGAVSSLLHALVLQADRAITLLCERRNAIISAAVTGKIDVRHAANSEAA